MTSNSSRYDSFTDRIGEVLFYVWDPFHVNLNPVCRSEYDSYVPIVAAYLSQNASEQRLKELLIYIGDADDGNVEINLKKKVGGLDETVRMLIEWRELTEEHSPHEFDVYLNVATSNPLEMQVKWSVAEFKKLFSA